MVLYQIMYFKKMALSEVSKASEYYHLLQINFEIQTPKPSDSYSLAQRLGHYLAQTQF